MQKWQYELMLIPRHICFERFWSLWKRSALLAFKAFHIMKWSKHNERLRGKAQQSFMALKPLLWSSLSFKSKFQLYKAYIRFVIAYLSPALSFIFKFNMNCLLVVQYRGHCDSLEMIGIPESNN